MTRRKLVRSQVDEALQRLGLKLSKRQTYEVYGRAEPEDDEDVLVPGGAAAATASPLPGRNPQQAVVPATPGL